MMLSKEEMTAETVKILSKEELLLFQKCIDEELKNRRNEDRNSAIEDFCCTVNRLRTEYPEVRLYYQADDCYWPINLLGTKLFKGLSLKDFKY